jgi:catechol 2,3-dioxygenase-like lactoylglutathione lyase family enzyme
VTAAAAERRPPVLGLNHIALHVRDVAEAVQFWLDVVGAQPYWFGGPPGPGQTRKLFSVELGGVVLAFFAQPGLAGWDLEFPHYAFTVSTSQMLDLKERLEAHGVKMHSIWTRHEVEGLVYFRDPSGNLFEFFCPDFEHAKDRQVTALDANYGGAFRPPVNELRYEWTAGRGSES